MRQLLRLSSRCEDHFLKLYLNHTSQILLSLTANDGVEERKQKYLFYNNSKPAQCLLFLHNQNRVQGSGGANNTQNYSTKRIGNVIRNRSNSNSNHEFIVRRCWLPNYSSVAFWFLFYFGDLFVCFILLGYITKRSSFKKMLRYSRNTLISLRNGWKSQRTTLTPIQASLHLPLLSQTWNELKSLNLLSSRRVPRGRLFKQTTIF